MWFDSLLITYKCHYYDWMQCMNEHKIKYRENGSRKCCAIFSIHMSINETKWQWIVFGVDWHQWSNHKIKENQTKTTWYRIKCIFLFGNYLFFFILFASINNVCTMWKLPLVVKLSDPNFEIYILWMLSWTIVLLPTK